MASILLIIMTAVAVAAVAAVGPLITRRMSVRVNLTIVCGYLGAMLLLSAVCAVIPASALRPALDPAQASETFDNAGRAISAGFKAGSSDAPEGIAQTIASFDAPSDRIVLSVAHNLPGLVYVGTKGVDAPDDGRRTVEVYSYAYGFVVFSETYYGLALDPPSVISNNGILSVAPADMKTVNLFRFDDRNTLPQFFGTDPAGYGGGTYAFQMVVILLPPGVVCTGGNTEPLSSLGSAVF